MSEVWMHSTNDVEWNSHEEYATREEAIEDAPRWHDLKPGARFFVGRKVAPAFSSDWGSTIVEQLGADAYDYAPCDAAEEWPDCTKEQEEELSAEVDRVVRAWIERHGLTPNFYGIEQVTEHRAPEAPEGEPC